MKNFIYTLLLGTTLSTGLDAAENPCYLNEETASIIQGTIEKISNKNVYVRQSGENARMCIVSMNVRIKGNWITAFGKQQFTPDITEQSACMKAEEKGKIKALQTVMPEKMRSIQEYKCDTRKGIGEWRVIDDNSYLPWSKPKFIGDRL